MNRTPSLFRTRNSRGTILIVTLVLVSMIAMIAAGMLYRTLADVRAAAAGRDGQQAYLAARSGITKATLLLMAARDDDELWYDNPDEFREQLVLEDGVQDWYFTIYTVTDDEQVRYGLSDESGKININAASQAQLLLLPGMTEELADTLMDWRDADDETRPNGAETEYYKSLKPVGYAARNGPFLTVEELLQVKGFDMQLVCGEDATRNGRLDPNEDDGDESLPDDNADGVLDRGLIDLATTFSYEYDVAHNGKPRVNINGQAGKINFARSGISKKTQNFINAYRNDGQTFQHPVDLLNKTYRLKKRYRSYRAGRTISSGVGVEQLETVLDKLTTSGGGKAIRMGLVNVNRAPAKVLATVPGIDAGLAEEIVTARENREEPAKTSASLLIEELVDIETYKKIAPYLTGRGFQYRLRVVGYSRPGGRFCVLEAVIDLASGTPRLMYLRDLTKLGVPIDLDEQATTKSN